MTPMTTGPVSTQVHGTIHLVRLDDSAVNALTLDVIDELSAAITIAERGEALVIAGRPGCFTAGLDRNAMLSGDRAAVSTMLRRVTGLFEQLLQHPTPTVVACTGHALAAGALLLLVADARIGITAPCRVGFNETQIGLPLAPLAVAAARARLAPQALLQATLHGTVYTGHEAVRAGYLDEVVDPDVVLDTAMRRAAGLAGLDRRAYLRTRKLVWAPVLAEVESAIAQRRAAAAS
jgi:enoyl-CoA hydratase